MIHPACDLCRGACCESISLSINHDDPDVQRWIDLHGTRLGTLLNLPCKCQALVDGKCSIYADRPQVCRDFKVGSIHCRDAVYRQRTETERIEILRLLNDST